MRTTTLASLILGAFLALVSSSLNAESSKSQVELDSQDYQKLQENSTIQADGDVVVYHEDFEAGAGGWVSKDLSGGGGPFWHWAYARDRDDYVMECSSTNSCFTGYGNRWKQELTKSFSDPVRQSLEDLIVTTTELVAKPSGLIAKLNEALMKWEHNDVPAISGKLKDFIDQVNALIKSGKLSPAGQQLVYAAQDIAQFVVAPQVYAIIETSTEENYDFVHVLVSTDGGATFVYKGRVSGNVGWNPSIDLTGFAAGDELVVRFVFTSDCGYSDEDGIFQSRGFACRLAGVRVIGWDNFWMGNDGWIASVGTADPTFRLESQLPQEFTAEIGQTTCGSMFGTLFCRTGLAPLTSHAWAAYDPETGVLPFTPGYEPGAVLPSWFGAPLIVAIESPTIPIPAAEKYFLEFDVYWDQFPVQIPREVATGVAVGINVASGSDHCQFSELCRVTGISSAGNGAYRVRREITSFIDPGASSVAIQLRAVDFLAANANWFGDFLPTRHGRGPYFDNVALIAQGVLSKTAAETLPQKFVLGQNQPNPFNPTTTIRLSLPTASAYTLSIHDVAGRVVRRYEGTSEPGQVSIVWDGTNDTGNRVGSGIYFYKVQAGDFAETRRMVLLK